MPDDPYQYPTPPHDPAIRPREPAITAAQMTEDALVEQSLLLLARVRALEADGATCREVLAEVKIVRQQFLQVHIELAQLRKQCEGLAAMLTRLVQSHPR